MVEAQTGSGSGGLRGLRSRFFGLAARLDWPGQVASLMAAGLVEPSLPTHILNGLENQPLEASSLDTAVGPSVTFALTIKPLEKFVSVAGSVQPHPALIVIDAKLFDEATPLLAGTSIILLPSKWPRVAFGKLIEALYPDCTRGWNNADWTPEALKANPPRIDPTASIAPSAQIGAGVAIGANCEIGPNAVIGANVILGERCRVGANATLLNLVAGDDCNFLANSVVGERGYGVALAPALESKAPASAYEIPQIGGVRFGNRCEVRHFAAVDRGSLTDTIIGDDVHIDSNSVVGHSCRIGNRVSIGAFAGLGGNSQVGDNCILWARCAVQEGRHLGPKSELKYGTIVTKDFPSGGQVLKGDPAMPVVQWQRRMGALSRLLLPNKPNP